MVKSCKKNNKKGWSPSGSDKCFVGEGAKAKARDREAKKKTRTTGKVWVGILVGLGLILIIALFSFFIFFDKDYIVVEDIDPNRQSFGDAFCIDRLPTPTEIKRSGEFNSFDDCVLECFRYAERKGASVECLS